MHSHRYTAELAPPLDHTTAFLSMGALTLEAARAACKLIVLDGTRYKHCGHDQGDCQLTDQSHFLMVSHVRYSYWRRVCKYQHVAKLCVAHMRVDSASVSSAS